ncbi:MAG: caspase family protein [Actinomycetota bacterium]|nr:caspase family protein [Actinomycetota bacterium]
MDSAAVLIGVDRTGGGLPVLRDAAASARRMEEWAQAQGMKHVVAITDEDGKSVDVSIIKKAIRDLTELGTVERLIVFFAGHGININRGERWLLSDAPNDPQAAVNVPGSADLARTGGIPYVAMISDACRTAAVGIQAQGVTGSEIFPNEEIAELELPVDQFFACRLGRPSHEIADAQATTKEYKAIYTQALVDALKGADPTVVDPQGYVRPRPLKKFLQAEVAQRISGLALQTKLIQVPDARISSDETAWLSRLGDGTPTVSGGGGGMEERFGGGELGGETTTRAVLGAMLAPVLYESLGEFDDRLSEASHSDVPRIADIGAEVERIASTVGSTRFETDCGFKVDGARVDDVVVGELGAEPNGEHTVCIDPRHGRGGDVLLVLDNGLGVALPAIPEFLTTVTVEDGEIAGVAYEPSEGAWRWRPFAKRAREVRALRAVAASSSDYGVFELDERDAYQVAMRMQYAKAIDPALAVYASYAYADQGRRELIREMYALMVADLGGALFDVALLARRPGNQHSSGRRLLGFAPLLAQGWALLPASRMELPPSLRGVWRHVLPNSLWTAYDPGGVELIRRAFAEGEVR